MTQLSLDTAQINAARASAQAIATAVHRAMAPLSTVSVERATLRLIGIDGVDGDGVPLPNRLVDHLTAQGLLAGGALLPVMAAMVAHDLSAQEVAQRVAQGTLTLEAVPEQDKAAARAKGDAEARKACQRIKAKAALRQEFLDQHGDAPTPWRYLIVATGNIYEDIVQAVAAADQGADVIAVIRSTGQSLIDFVPYGATTEGFGGTYATQENFRLMRAALDEAGARLGRYIRLTNYCSGLCMPEIAAMGAMERLDMMLNDAMYGIIFRDINVRRTLIDQFFSRMINGYAGIIINTGEDNYLTTADACDSAHTVLASQLINEQFAALSGLPPAQMGLGHAYEINPAVEDSFLLEIAHAQLVRQVFPDHSLKYMPPTKYMTGNIFKGHVQDALFNIASVMTGQHIHLLGMMTEAIHTPFLQDRHLALQNADYIFTAMRHLTEEIGYKSGGRIEQRAQLVLAEAATMLREIEAIGLEAAIGRAMFADIARTPEGGRGLAGVFDKAADYYNPFPDLMLGQTDDQGEKRMAPPISPTAPPAPAPAPAHAPAPIVPDAPKLIRPYGDTMDDGRVQLSFTLPMPCDDRAKEAARQHVLAMGLNNPAIAHAEPMGPDFAFFIVYAESPFTVDPATINPARPEFEALDKDAIDALIMEMMGRKMVIIGACIETDAHTVGIDAIMNMKGFNGHKGLESYHSINALNLGAQVDSATLVARAMEARADVILVSQVVTQKDIHIDNLTRLRRTLDATPWGKDVIIVAGGPRITHELAAELGFDAGFGPGSYAEDVASFAIHEWMRRHAHQSPVTERAADAAD